MKIGEIINEFAFYSVLLPPLVAAILWKQISLGQIILAGFCLVSMGLQLIAPTFNEILGTDFPNFHFYILIEFLAFSTIYFLEWRKKQLGKIIKSIIIGFIFLTIFSAIWYPGIMNSPFLTMTIGRVIIIAFATIFMGKTFKNMPYERLEKVFIFWFSTGILVYFTGTMLSSIFIDYIITSDKVFFAVWAGRDTLTTLFYLVCAISMLCKDQKTL